MGVAVPPSEDDKITSSVQSDDATSEKIASKQSAQPSSSRSTRRMDGVRNERTRTQAAQPVRRRERLEDVFQDEIVKQFAKLPEFKRFARSQYGLRLSEYDIENIVEDYRGQSEEQRLKLLNLWKQKLGKEATPEKIRHLVQQYKDKKKELDDDENY